MKPTFARILSALLLAFLLAGCGRMQARDAEARGTETHSAEARGTAFMWEVRDGEAKLYLLGSIHAAKGELYPLKPVIMEAFEESDVLAVECDVTAITSRPDYLDLMKKVMYNDGTTIKDHIPDDLYEKADAILRENGLSIGLYIKYKPFMLASIISSCKLSEWGYDPYNGIDIHLIGLAKEMDKDVAEIESADFQYEMLGGFSDEIQLLELRNTVEGIESSREFMDEMFRYWVEGDVKSFEELVFQEDESLSPHEIELNREYEKRLFDDRNVGMVQKAEEYLKSGKTYFFVVGAGHMVGETGIIKLLRDKGYDVVQK
jgi:uncharacterized protein YbaP (TraB family)